MDLEEELFKLNENLKEKLVTEYNCNKALTVYHKKGSFLIEESFYETEAFWYESSDFRKLTKKQGKELAELFYDLISSVAEMGGQVVGPRFERHKQSLVMVWGLFGKYKTL
jgi:hypothetical protein